MTTPEAVLCPERIDEDKKKTVLFVCTGNTCRSPMAAALFNHLYKDSCYHAESAGIMCPDGDPIAENAAEALMRRGVLPTPDNNYVCHRSRLINESIVKSSDLIVGLSSHHTVNIIVTFPMYVRSITSMPKNIADPFGGDLATYEKCLASIEASLAEIFALLENSAPTDGSCDDGTPDGGNDE